jgi:hypothetical protein
MKKLWIDSVDYNKEVVITALSISPVKKMKIRPLLYLWKK